MAGVNTWWHTFARDGKRCHVIALYGTHWRWPWRWHEFSNLTRPRISCTGTRAFRYLCMIMFLAPRVYLNGEKHSKDCEWHTLITKNFGLLNLGHLISDIKFPTKIDISDDFGQNICQISKICFFPWFWHFCLYLVAVIEKM